VPVRSEIFGVHECIADVAQHFKAVVCPEAPQACHADCRPGYAKADAEEGWALALDLVQDPRRGLTRLLR
jgi:hypothetical protein